MRRILNALARLLPGRARTARMEAVADRDVQRLSPEDIGAAVRASARGEVDLATRASASDAYRRLWTDAVQVVALVLLAAACDGGGGNPIAEPGDLRLDIIRGASQTGQVKPAPPGALQASAELLPVPVVVRISVVGGSASVGVVGTGPSLAAAIPAGAIVNWRVIGEGCGAPFAGVTAVEGTDSVVNFWRRGTRAGTECKMVAEGVAGGQMFGSDTARAEFTAGSPSRTFDSGVSSIAPFPLLIGVDAVRDAYGNAVPFRVLPEGVIGVAGAEFGTATARTATYTGPATGSGIRTVLPIVNASGVHVGKLLVEVLGDGASGWYRAVGVDVPIS